MKKGLLVSLSIATALSTASIATGVVTNTFWSPSVVQAAALGSVYVFDTKADVYNAPNGTITRSLPMGSGWQYFETQKDGSGTTWYRVGTSEWINDKQAVTSIQPGSVKAETGTVVITSTATVWTTPNLHKETPTRTLPVGSTWKYFRTFKDSWQQTWYNVGGTEWVRNAEAGKLGNARTMTATAYDPKVLGSDLPYDTVAAYLGDFPRGTRLLVTLSNGTKKIYTVRDTGAFAATNHNQIDLAMPNWQAVQFGRQTVTVNVIN
jgi:3D (Asp-Asp-Asp) domain-containing protein